MSPDLFDVEEGGLPDNVESFAILVQCLVGDEGPAADTFDLVVLSPDQMAAQIPASGVLSGRGFLIMNRYDPLVLRSTVEQWVQEAEASDWPTAAARLSRHMIWEYEGEQ